MNWNTYEERYRNTATSYSIPEQTIEENLNYAYNLYNQKVPIIYDQNHLALLIGIEYEYLLKVSNSSQKFYRKFILQKKNGASRTIHEPLPNLKVIQKWILQEILENIKISSFAKAYKKNSNLKDNVRFHRNQKYVLRLDIKDFFGHIKQRHVLRIFLQIGYSVEVSVLLAKLCTLQKKLPQGAPTSACISNIVLRNFDEEISKYCTENSIRYTRYADDMNFSGDFKVNKLIKYVETVLGWHGLYLNKDKTNLMRQHNRQLVTGIVVNEKIQVRKNIRRELRKEIYYINKYGIDDHLRKIGKSTGDRKEYLASLIGKIGFCKFINPQDEFLNKSYTNLLSLLNDL